MHKYRSAARTAAWFDSADDPPDYNPFRKIRPRRQDRFAVYNVSDDGAGGTVWDGPTETVSETDRTAATDKDIVRVRRNHTAPSIAPSDEVFPRSHNTIALRKSRRKADWKGKVENGKVQKEEAPLGDGKPELDHQDNVPPRARSWRNIFRRRTIHGLLQEEHTHIGQKIGEIGRSIAAHGSPSAELDVDPAGERKALVIDFEKDVGRAKDSSSTKTKSSGGPRLYQCTHAKTLFSGLASLHHPSITSSDHALHLRVFHVENKPEILEDIFSIFKLSSTDFSRYGTEFRHFALNDFTERRSGRQTWFWRPSFDKTRNVLRLAFSLEYHTIRTFDPEVYARTKRVKPDGNVESPNRGSSKESGVSLAPGYEFDRKRLSIYIQHKQSNHLHRIHPNRVRGEATTGPAQGPSQDHDVHTEKSDAPSMQNIQDTISSENSILIVEKTLASGNSIFQAEDQWKQLWTGSEISLFPPGERDGTATLELLQAIVRFSFNKIVSDWRGYIKVMDKHISSLEERNYDKPEDDSQAKELWRTSKQLLDMEKLLISQTFLIKVVQDNFINPGGPETGDKDWLKDLLTDFEELRNDIQEDLIKTVTQMVDLMYKSVSIQDARKSVELNTSLWRLSWITFIFLPLTFLVGFFGMNVDTFHNTPSIKWYFITAVPFMCFILLLWFSIKYFMDRGA